MPLCTHVDLPVLPWHIRPLARYSLPRKKAMRVEKRWPLPGATHSIVARPSRVVAGSLGPGEVPTSMERAPYFFLAYAHTPERPWVNKFYSALSKEILENTDWPTEYPVGFMDESGIRLGEDWRDAVAGALATCRVLVPLYSRRYFSRPQCGTEWHAFNRRLDDHRDRHGFHATAIVPALWTPVAEEYIPEAVKNVQV